MKKLTVRQLRPDDIPKLVEAYNKKVGTPFPDLANQLYFCNRVVEDEDGQLIGAGIVRLTTESILVVDDNQPATIRVRAIKELFNTLKDEVSILGMDETHAFIAEEDYALRLMLKQLFGFVDCKNRAVYLQF
jgi:hypothetical protein